MGSLDRKEKTLQDCNQSSYGTNLEQQNIDMFWGLLTEHVLTCS